MALSALLASLNSCCNPWIYMLFSGHLLGDRNRNTLSRKSSHPAAPPSPYEVLGSPAYAGGVPAGQGAGRGGEEVLHHPTEEIPLAPTGEYKPASCGTLTRREVYL